VRVLRFREHDALSTVVLPKNVERPDVMLFAHLDVVPLPEGTEYRSVIKNGRLYGPGAGDMKGELAILLVLFRAFHQSRPGISLGLAVTSDEETGGTHGTRFLFEDFGLRCGTAIIPDSGSVNDIAVEEKGTLHLKVRAKGTAGHACRPWLSDNPMDRMIAAMNRIRSYFDALKTSDDYWYPTCAFTAFQTPNRVPNRIPDAAEMICDVRFPPPYSIHQMLGTIQQLLGEHMEMEALVSAEPTLLSPDPLYLKVTEEITGQPVRLLREHGGSDARYVARYGIPVIMSRPLIGNLHTDNEWVDVASMETLYRIYERYLALKLNPVQ
ncbi:MAG TPA: M20 family metallopeptidase, partial [Candidatus Binatia bacterium]